MEITIAVVILGIVLAMTLKGRELVENVRGLMAVYGIEQFQNRVLSYQSQYSALPGDDPVAPRRFKRDPALVMMYNATVSFAGDDKIDGKLFDTLSPNGEQFMAWRDLRAAGMVSGDVNLVGASAMPPNPFGGVYGFDEGNLGQTKGSLCLTRVPGRAAQAIDAKLDDGAIDTGKVVATANYDPAGAFNHFDAPDSEPYSIEKEYIICAPIMP